MTFAESKSPRPLGTPFNDCLLPLSMMVVVLALLPFSFSLQKSLASPPAVWGKSAARSTSLPWILSMTSLTALSCGGADCLRRRLRGAGLDGVFETDILCFKSSVDLVRAVMPVLPPP